MRSFYTMILILSGVFFTSDLQAQACDFISGNINVGGDIHDPGLQSNNNKNTVATLSNGNFVVAWETRDGIDGDDAGAFFQVFSETGAVVTSIIMPYADINPSGTGKQGSNGPLVVALTGGGFAIGWESEDGPGDTGDVNQDVYFRVYSNDGTAVSGTTRISVVGEEDHLEYILPLSTGGFVILTRIEESDQIPGNPDNNNNTDDFFFQAFNASGNATSGSPLNITSDAHAESFQNTYSGLQTMADLGNGNFVIAWEGRNDIDGDGNGGFFRVFNANGTAVTGVIMPYSDINAAGTGDQGRFGPQVVALAGGNFVTSWESRGGPGDVGMGGDQDQDVYFRVYGPTGTAVSGTVKANGDNTAEEDNLDAIIPLTGGNFAIVYHTDEVSTDTDDFYFRVFNASGSAVSSSIEVSGGLHTDIRSFMSNDDHRFAALNNGNFVLGWSTSGSTDGSATECYYRVFNATGAAVSEVVRPYADINPTGIGNQGSGGPTLKALPEGFAVVWPSEQGPGDVGPGSNDDQDVYHQVVNNDGVSLCGTIKTNAGNDSQEEIFEYAQPLQNGNFMVLYRDDEDDPTFANQDDYFLRVIGGAPEQAICPTVATISGPPFICTSQPFTLTASGLENMTLVDNDDQNYSITFVVSTVSTTNPYVNTSVLGTVPFNELAGNNTTATLANITTNFPNSTLYFYAILGELPDNDNCRPFVELVLQNDQTPIVTFTAPTDLCADAGVQTGLGAGSPTGGVYSGPGVTDDGNGMTYSFNPATAGVGEHTISYSITVGNCSATAADEVMVNATPTVTFTAPTDLCADAGVQTGLGAGSPTGGVYSGPGVTDDGNGMTYSFNPATAGVGEHTISYSVTVGNCSATAADEVMVNATPTVTFTAPTDLCADAGVQSGLGAGSPTGGVYSGPGVTDDGNGMTYSFNPATAGVGEHTISYSVTVGNCSATATDEVMVNATPTVTFTAPADLCADAGVQSGLGAGSPTGGVYSGPGVTDDGNGMTYSFNPATAGVGEHTITYTVSGECSGMSSGMVTVYSTPDVNFTALPDLAIGAGVQTGLSGGTPVQGTVTGDSGVYSGPGVTDDGNGMTYSFDPAAAGVGVHTLSYTYTNANGCSQTATDGVTVSGEPLPGDMCTDALDINALFGQAPLVPQISEGQDNTGYGTDATDPATGFECHFEADPLQNTSWYAFVGDGNRYLIRTIVCNDSPANLDLQAAVYSGECGTLTDVVCNEDEDGGNSIFNVSLEMDTEMGTTYLLMLDGYVGTTGAFCLEVTNLTTVGVTDLASANLRVYPNPTTGEVQLPALSVERVEVFDASGRLVINQEMPGSSIDLTTQQSGFYLLKMYTKKGVYSTKVVKD